MTRQGLAYAVCLLGAALAVGPGQAQDMAPDLTEAEIVDRFRQQKTRGLSIAPVSQTAGQDGTQAANQTGGQPAPGATAIVGPGTDMRILPADQQVNINIAFDFDSAALREDQKPRLIAMCGAMNAIETETFRILGHTDALGTEAYNQRLSLLRAEEVQRYLIADCGIAPERLKATGMGERFLFDPNDPRADVNRRVEFQVIG